MLVCELSFILHSDTTPAFAPVLFDLVQFTKRRWGKYRLSISGRVNTSRVSYFLYLIQ